MLSLSREDMLRENQDPAEEIEWGKRMSSLRSKFLKELVDEMEAEKRRKKNAQMVPPVSVAFQSQVYSGRCARISSDAISWLILHLSDLGDITSGRHSRTQRGGNSTDEGSRGSSYGHEVPPQAQGVQQPTPRHAQPTQSQGK